VSARTGLAAEVPTLDLCHEMAGVPALLKQFSRSDKYADDGAYAQWHVYAKGDDLEGDLVLRYEDARKYKWFYGGKRLNFYATYPAPTVREMLAWLEKLPYTKVKPHDTDFSVIVVTGLLTYSKRDITDPDAMARACIEAAK